MGTKRGYAGRMTDTHDSFLVPGSTLRKAALVLLQSGRAGREKMAAELLAIIERSSSPGESSADTVSALGSSKIDG